MHAFVPGISDLLENVTGAGVTLHVGTISIGAKINDIEIAKDILAFYTGLPFTTGRDWPDFDIEMRRSGVSLGRFSPRFQTYIGGEPIFTPFRRRLGVPYFDSAINWSIGTRILRYLLIHAAVVEKAGVGILLPAASGAGKSTLTAALVAEGWRLLSDEVAIVSPEDGLVWPHPRPISLKNDAIELIAKRCTQLADFRIFDGTAKGRVGYIRAPAAAIRDANKPAVPRLIIFPRYLSGLEGRNQTRLEKADSFARLVRQSANYEKLLHTGFETLADLVERCDHYELSYSNLDSALSAVEELASRHSRGP